MTKSPSDDQSLDRLVREQVDTLVSGAAEVLSPEDLAAKIRGSLMSGQPLRVKLGADPSAPDIHLGHAVVLWKLRQFQELGHRITFVIGDYTGMIGDPSGRSKTRPQLTEEEIRENARTYQDQVYRILDPDKSDVSFNSKWLGPLKFVDIIHLASKYTVARMLERDDFEKRYRSEQPISLHEFLYPLAQAYDSVHLEADVELGGTDQKFNFLMTRHIQREYGQEPQVAMTMPLLVGIDGQEKMSKSLGNYVSITEAPESMYGKLMSISDDHIGTYLTLAAGLDRSRVQALEHDLQTGMAHPREIKAQMALRVVTLYHGESAARRAEEEFDRVFIQKDLPSEIPVVAIPPDQIEKGDIWIVSLIRQARLASSNGEARRLIEGGGVYLDGQRITDQMARLNLKGGEVLKVGKRRFARVELPGRQT